MPEHLFGVSLRQYPVPQQGVTDTVAPPLLLSPYTSSTRLSSLFVPMSAAHAMSNSRKSSNCSRKSLKDTLLDVGWATFTEIVSARAARAGRVVVFVNPFKTSQMCSGCGAEVKNNLSERWYSCNGGTELDRDTNAALTILKLGHKALSGGTRSTSVTV